MNAKQEAFAKLRPEEQRVAIAKDVIKQLRLKTLKAEHGTYLNLDKAAEVNGDAQLCDVIDGQKCEVCALGGMMIASVLLANELKVSEVWWGGDRLYGIGGEACLSYLSRFFPYEQLKEIEAAFEGWTEAEHRRVKQFRPKLHGATKRLTAVMKNIIANNGTFVWPVEEAE